MLFDLFAIATGIEFWHDLLLAMFDVNATYWNLLWGGFIVLGGAVFVLGCLLLKRRLSAAIEALNKSVLWLRKNANL